MRQLSHQPSNPAYYIADCRISGFQALSESVARLTCSSIRELDRTQWLHLFIDGVENKPSPWLTLLLVLGKNCVDQVSC